MADEDDRKWLPPTDSDDDRPGDTLPGVPGSFSGGPDVPGAQSGPSGLSSGDPLGGSGAPSGPGEGGGLWSSQPGPSQGPPPPGGSGEGGWDPPSRPTQPGDWGAPSQPPQPGGWGGQQSFEPYGEPVAPTNGKATAALILGILGLVFCPFICSVLALVFGYQARGEIDRSGGRQGGRGLATAGVITGWIGIAITLLFVLLIVIGVLATDDFDFDNGDSIGRPAMVFAARALTLLPL
jgi:hypothetical protein